jgi:hypothetical protein
MSTPTPPALPTAAELAGRPRDELAALLGAILVALLQAPAVSPAPTATSAPPEEWIGPDEVTRRFGIPKGWLRRHGGQLRRAGILSKLGAKTNVYSAAKLRRYIESHSGR